MIDKSSSGVSLARQLNLLSIPKSSYYYNRSRIGRNKNCRVKEDIRRIFISEPTYGVHRIKDTSMAGNILVIRA